MITKLALVAFVAPIALAGCQSTTYNAGAPKLIARNSDSMYGNAPGPVDDVAALAVTPDGCEVWIIDDGLEGYATNRTDPRTGLPVCNSKYPSGSVIGDPSASADIPDILP